MKRRYIGNMIQVHTMPVDRKCVYCDKKCDYYVEWRSLLMKGVTPLCQEHFKMFWKGQLTL